jgi:hypothetical protein
LQMGRLWTQGRRHVPLRKRDELPVLRNRPLAVLQRRHVQLVFVLGVLGGLVVLDRLLTSAAVGS